MSFDWWDYIRIAEEIFSNAANNMYSEKDKEAWLRAAISRAYYGAHMLLRKKMLADGFITQQELDREKGRIHSFVYEKVKHPLKATLEMLLRYRKKADYENQFPAIESVCSSTKSLLQHFKKNLPKADFVT